MDERKILVVDDSADMRMLMERILTRDGFSVLTAESGTDALVLLESDNSINLIFLDLMMPNIDGFGVLEKLQTIRDARPPLKVAVVSGLKDKGDIIRSLKLKADDYILKPIDPKIVSAKARHLLGDATTDSEFVWLEKHMACDLLENVILLRFTLVHFSEHRCMFESSVPFALDTPFAFKCDKLTELAQLPTPELRARVDSCEAASPAAARFRVFATFIGNPETTMQKIRLFTQKNARRRNASPT